MSEDLVHIESLLLLFTDTLQEPKWIVLVLSMILIDKFFGLILHVYLLTWLLLRLLRVAFTLACFGLVLLPQLEQLPKEALIVFNLWSQLPQHHRALGKLGHIHWLELIFLAILLHAPAKENFGISHGGAVC